MTTSMKEAATKVTDAIHAARERGGGFTEAAEALGLDPEALTATVDEQAARLNGDSTIDGALMHGLLIGAVAAQCPDGINWAEIGRVAMHPTQQAILALMADGEKWSPNLLSGALDMALGNVSYHVKELYESDNPDKPSLIETAGTEPRRGAVEHYYVRRKTPKLRGKGAQKS